MVIRERIDPAITASLFANYRSAVDAVMELMDNAVDSRIGDQPLDVSVTVHATTISIECRGGEGMGPGELKRYYLVWGGSPKKGKRLLGQYGQGGKAAIGHLGAGFMVEASRPGDSEAWRFNDPDYRDRASLKTYELKPVEKKVAADVGYVRIRIDKVDKKIEPKRLSARLGDTYRQLIVKARLRIAVNGTRVDPVPIRFKEDHPFRVRAAGGTLEGWWGIAEPEGRGVDYLPGLRCYRHGRLIASGEFFGHPNAVQVSGMASLVGEVDIPNVPLTMNKSDFVRDTPEWQAVESRMHKVLEPVARQLAQDEEAPPPASAVKVAEQVRRLLGQALRLADRDQDFPGRAAAASKPVADRTTPRAATASAGDRPPSPPRSSDDGARRGFGNVVVRPLDQSIRSQTVSENGTATIVINSLYPLFLKRHGDMWYQMETAAREVFKATEASSVVDYERRVNEVMLLALRLRDRTREKRSESRRKQLDLL